MNSDGKVHISRLRLMARSPAHYRGVEQKDEYFLERGTAVHALVLGGPRVISYPGAVRRGKEWEAFKAANADAVILTKKECEKAICIAESVTSNALAMSVLQGQREHLVEWTRRGRACSSRIDALGASYVTELKCVQDGSPGRFPWQARRMGWYAQLAFYAEAAGLGDLGEQYVVAVESTAPYVVTTYRLDDSAKGLGRLQVALWWEMLMTCEASQQWPGYCESLMTLSAPDDDDVGLIFPEGGDDGDDE